MTKIQLISVRPSPLRPTSASLRLCSRVFFSALSFAPLLLILLLTGCGEKPKVGPAPFPVLVAEVTERDAPIFIETFGTALSPLDVQIRPQVGGIVEKAFVTQGQYVKKGDPLYQIDPRPYQAALDRAKAVLLKDQAILDLAEITVARNKDLVKKDYISKLTYEQYVANVEAAKGQLLSDQADIELATLNLEWCKPVSPIDGKISQYNIDPGNLVIANDTAFLTNVRQINPIDIQFTIPQKHFVEVQEAKKAGTLKVFAILPERANQPREGNLFFVDNHVDPTTNSILIKGRIDNSDELLWPGEYIRVRLQLRMHRNGLIVPEAAVQVGQKGPFVYVYDPQTSTVAYRSVVKSERIDENILITKGVSKGEMVVIKGMINLRPGAAVSLVTSSAASDEPPS